MSKRKISVGDKIYAVHLYLDGVSVGRFSPQSRFKNANLRQFKIANASCMLLTVMHF